MAKKFAEKICDGKFQEETATKTKTYSTVVNNDDVEEVADELLNKIADALATISELFAQYRALKGGEYHA